MKLALLKIAPYVWVVAMIAYAIMTLLFTSELFGIGTIPMILFNLFTWVVLYLANIGASEFIGLERSLAEDESKTKKKGRTR